MIKNFKADPQKDAGRRKEHILKLMHIYKDDNLHQASIVRQFDILTKEEKL